MSYSDDIKEWIDIRVKRNETTRVRFCISPKDCHTNIYENQLIHKIEKMFERVGINTRIVDTVAGSFNLNRDFLETDIFDAIVEYCGVYPIKMDTKDSAWLSKLDDCGDVRIFVFTYDKDNNQDLNG